MTDKKDDKQKQPPGISLPGRDERAPREDLPGERNRKEKINTSGNGEKDRDGQDSPPLPEKKSNKK
jgi:hypothetical protein